MASAPGFTGAFSVNATTGVISIANASPAGQFKVAVTVTDNCEVSTTAQFTLAVIQPGTLLEADVSPRPNGNGSVSIADWAQIGRFVAGLDTTVGGSELQRADCAPRATFGDGKLTVADWVQAGRYAAGLDPLTVAAGPMAFASSLLARTTSQQLESTRELRAVSNPMLRGTLSLLPLRFIAVGNENALGFSLSFDPKLLTFYRATPIAGATLTLNTKQIAQGNLGILVSLPAGQTFPAGEVSIVNLAFLPQGGEGETKTRLVFNDQVISCEIADVNANAITQFARTDSDITISGRAAAHVSAASYVGTQAASDSIISAFGTNLATVIQAATTVPLPNTLGGTSVLITDSAGNEHAAPLFFVAPNQINYLIPDGLPEGVATVAITNAAGAVARGLLKLERVAPGIFSADASGRGLAAADVQRLRPDGTPSYERVARFDPNTNQFMANPIALRADEQAFLILYGTGLRYRSDLTAVKARIGGLATEVLYVGPQGSYAGLDQINLRLPLGLIGRQAQVLIEIEIDGQFTNPVKISVQ